MYLHCENFAALHRETINIAHKTTTTATTKSIRKMNITHRIRGVGGGRGRGGCRSNSSFSTSTGVCTCILQLLVALQMLMTLEMPLSTTMALPVTSKPIESTAENLAWQAWIMLPPEQKQLIKSRKVTPKSIFTLPLRVECPEGHQQVDTKCIPTVIGSNTVLIDPNVLGLVLGNAPTDIEYDYEDEAVGEEHKPHVDMVPYNPPMHLKDTLEGDASKDELRPPSPDEPLKFNIFQNTFPTDDYAMEDYSAVSNEGSASGGRTQETDDNAKSAVVLNETLSISLNVSANVSMDRDLVSEASSNISKVHSFSTLPDSSDFNLDDIDAISLPASGDYDSNSHKISLFKEDSSLHLVTADMDTDSTKASQKEYVTQAVAESDLETLLQTESLMPMINQTATSAANQTESSAANKEENKVSDDAEVFDLNIEGEGMTTLPNIIEKDTMDTMESQDKAEFIRSVTMNPLSSGATDVELFGIEVTTLTPSTGLDDEAYQAVNGEDETATSLTIQLDETTIIEGNDESSLTTTTTPTATTVSAAITKSAAASSPSSSSSSLLSSITPEPAASATVETSATSLAPPTLQPSAEELTTLLWQQEQAIKDFEELQRLRKGQKNEHTVMKKSKVEPVEPMAATVTTTLMNLAETQATTNAMDELMTATETETATVTPLLKDANNDSNNNTNNNIDRFYYQHIAKQDLESQHEQQQQQQHQQQQQSSSTTTPPPPPSTAWSTDIETLASTVTTATMEGSETTSEIDLAQELRLINDLVKGKRSSAINSLTTASKAVLSATKTITATTTTAATTKKTIASTTPATATRKLNTDMKTADMSTQAMPVPSSSESSVNSIKALRATEDIWAKIMPFLQTTVTPPKAPTTTTTSESLSESSTTHEEVSTTFADPSSATAAVVSNRSHRNSKIIRLNGLNTINATPSTWADTTTEKSSTSITPTATTTTTTNEDNARSVTSLTTVTLDDASSSSASSSAEGAYEPFWWLPVAWRLDKPSTMTSSSTTTTPQPASRTPDRNGGNSEGLPLLLRFWSAYHAPKSS